MIKIESDLSDDNKVEGGDRAMKVRTMFLLGAFAAGIIFLTGVSSIIILFLADVKSTVYYAGTSIGALLIIIAAILLYYLKEHIR